MLIATCSMCQWLIRPALLLTTLFILLMVLIRAQPYDDHELRAFLTPPEGCPAPCFIGIRPGVTTAEEAIKILEGLPLLAGTIELDIPDIIKFRANNSYSMIDGTIVSHLSLENNLVKLLRVRTNISLGDLWAAYGQADWGYWTFPGGGENPPIFYAIGYNQLLVGFGFSIPYECWPGKFQYLLQQKVSLLLGTDMQENANFQPTLRLMACDETSY